MHSVAADKMSTIVMRVDLDCDKCFKKIRKVLCKIQDKVSVRTISFDEKTKTVAISGPFDAEEVADRLSSSAGKVITDMHVVGGGGSQKHVFNAPNKSGKGHGHGAHHGGHGGGGKQDKGHGGFAGFLAGGGGGKQDKGHGGFGGGKQDKGHGGFAGFLAGGGGGKQDKGHGGFGGGKQDKGHGGFGGGNKQEKGHGSGGKPDKKHAKFDFDDDDMSSDDDMYDDDEPAGHHAPHGANNNNGKPKIVTTTSSTPVAARLDAPRTGPSMSMRIPGMAPQQPQGMAVPSIWPAPAAPAAPEWGYSSAPQYGGGYNYSAGGSGYYGVPAATAYGYGGYGGAPAYGYGYGYGRNPYGAPPQQYYEEEPSAGCSVM